MFLCYWMFEKSVHSVPYENYKRLHGHTVFRLSYFKVLMNIIIYCSDNSIKKFKKIFCSLLKRFFSPLYMFYYRFVEFMVLISRFKIQLQWFFSFGPVSGFLFPGVVSGSGVFWRSDPDPDFLEVWIRKLMLLMPDGYLVVLLFLIKYFNCYKNH